MKIDPKSRIDVRFEQRKCRRNFPDEPFFCDVCAEEKMGKYLYIYFAEYTRTVNICEDCLKAVKAKGK